MGRVPDHVTGLSAPLAGQKRAPDSPEYSPVTSEDGEPTEPAPKRSSEDSPVTSEDDEPVGPALKRPKSDSTVIDGRSFSPMTGSDQDSPVSGIKTEAQAGDMDMAKVAAKLTDRQWTT
jgi:hypothetical protein